MGRRPPNPWACAAGWVAGVLLGWGSAHVFWDRLHPVSHFYMGIRPPFVVEYLGLDWVWAVSAGFIGLGLAALRALPADGHEQA